MRAAWFIALIVMLAAACSQPAGQFDQPAAMPPKGQRATPAPSPFQLTMDSLLHQHACIQNYKDVSAWQIPEPGIFPQTDSTATPSIWIDDHPFAMSRLEALQPDDTEMKTREYQIDSAFTFTLAGQRWGWLMASTYMCNGSGCRDAYYFLADFKLDRLYAFSVFNAPGTALLAGTLDGDAAPVLLIPDSTPWPPADTALRQTLSIVAWRRNPAGHWQPAMRERKPIGYTLTYDDDGDSVTHMRVKAAE